MGFLYQRQKTLLRHSRLYRLRVHIDFLRSLVPRWAMQSSPYGRDIHSGSVSQVMKLSRGNNSLLKKLPKDNAQLLSHRRHYLYCPGQKKKKKACPPPQREILYFPKLFTLNILETIVQKERLSVPFSRNMRDPLRIGSQYRLAPLVLGKYAPIVHIINSPKDTYQFPCQFPQSSLVR